MKNNARIALFFFLLTPFFTHAETVVRVGSDISVDANQSVDGDYYVSVGPFGNTTMSGEIKGDMYALGGVVTANGAVANDLTIFAGTTQVHATVTDDVRVVAGEVTIAEHVGGDVFVIGGLLKVLSTATIDGDVIFFGGVAEINGTIKGSILGTSEKMRIDAHVLKNVDVKTAEALTLGDRAMVEGYVTYASGNALVRGQQAVVKGEIHQAAFGTLESTVKRSYSATSFILGFVSLFTALSLFLLFRKELQTLVARVHNAPLKASLLGVVLLLLGPAICLLLMATVLGFLIGLGAMALTLLLLVLGYSVTGILFGSYLAKWFTRHPSVTLPWVVVGTLLIQALLFVPAFGILVLFVYLVMAIGGLLVGLYNLFA